MNWFKSMFSRKSISNIVSLEPDFPIPFGYKIAWYVIKGETPLSAIEKLKLTVISEANWETGLKEAYAEDKVFVSPLVKNCVLVVNLIPWKNDHVKVDGKLFSELQYFGNHRVAEYYSWAKFIDGELLRFYTYVGGEGQLESEGDLTPEELNLGFYKYPQEDYFDNWTDKDWDLAVFPDEDSVIGIAQSWGIDPFFSEQGYEKGLGYICRYEQRS